MNVRVTVTVAAAALALVASMPLIAQTRDAAKQGSDRAWTARTRWKRAQPEVGMGAAPGGMAVQLGLRF